MNRVLRTLGAGAAGIALLATSAVPAFAHDISVSVKDNGRSSDNKIRLDLEKKLRISQRNHVNIHNNIYFFANTGFNKAKDNTRGDVSIKTGDATSKVEVNNEVNGNFLDLNGCGCLESGEVTLKIEDNGRDSDNEINFRSKQETNISQSNNVKLENNVTSVANTGGNEASDNTRGDVEIETGDATSSVSVTNVSNGNFISF